MRLFFIQISEQQTIVFTLKDRKGQDYGNKNIRNFLLDEADERPLDLVACHSKNHDGVTQQIDDRLQAFESDNQMLTAAL
ncbi:MAG: hypothetical protein IJV38_04880 [Prevotella sp.]|nr:hypothetical protein [Prevotella sp.]